MFFVCLLHSSVCSLFPSFYCNILHNCEGGPSLFVCLVFVLFFVSQAWSCWSQPHPLWKERGYGIAWGSCMFVFMSSSPISLFSSIPSTFCLCESSTAFLGRGLATTSHFPAMSFLSSQELCSYVDAQCGFFFRHTYNTLGLRVQAGLHSCPERAP
jgi:hypothetical protein